MPQKKQRYADHDGALRRLFGLLGLGGTASHSWFAFFCPVWTCCPSGSGMLCFGGTVILKLTLHHKTDSTDRAAADCADFASACRFDSFRRFYVSFMPNFPVMLIVLDH